MIDYQKLLFASALLLCLTGCSVADMAYSRAPGYITGELEEAFDLSAAQTSQLGTRLEPFFIWHREEELSRYRDFFERAALSATDGITAEEFLRLRDDVGAAWNRAVGKGIDSLGDLFDNLTSEQIEQFRRYHRESSEEYRDYLEKSAQQREIYRVGRSFERLENWFGKFDSMLADRITERLRQVPDFYLPWIEYRERRHQALVAAMETGLTRQQFRTIMLDPSTDFARAFEPARQAYWQAYAAALEDISSWLSKNHRQHAVSRLQRYARVVERLRNQS